MPETVGAVIGVVCLRTDMALDLGTDFLSNHINARIGNDQRIRPDLSEARRNTLHTVEISIVRQDIGGHVYFHIMGMGKSNPLLRSLPWKSSSPSRGVRTLRLRYILRLLRRSQQFLILPDCSPVSVSSGLRHILVPPILTRMHRIFMLHVIPHGFRHLPILRNPCRP